jgi:hypothetical protein
MAKVKSIKVGFGVSIAKTPGNWIKANSEMEIEFDKPEDQEIKEDIWASAWERVTEETGNQLKKFDETTP